MEFLGMPCHSLNLTGKVSLSHMFISLVMYEHLTPPSDTSFYKIIFTDLKICISVKNLLLKAFSLSPIHFRDSAPMQKGSQ